MLRNYLKIAYRNLRRRPGYTAINVGGLAVGMACCILIGLWVQDELSYDDFHEAAGRTYRLALYYKLSPDHEGDTFTLTPWPLAGALERLFPQVEQAVRVARAPRVVLRGEQKFVEENFYFAGRDFFEMFSFPLLEGEAGQVLGEPGSLVLTRSAAEKYFPDDENPVGQTLRVGEGENVYEVTGVAADLPSNTHFGFDMVARLPRPDDPSWGPNQVVTYARLSDGARPDALQSKLTELILNRRPWSDDPGQDYALYLQPITGIHLGQGLPPGVELTGEKNLATFGGTGSIMYVYIFSALAVLVLLIACVNFMNLATARSADRAQEVGMRKALGAHREQLAGQFLGEAVVMSLLALLVALALARLALPALNALAGKMLSLSTLYSGPYLLVLLGLTVLVGLIAGSYPAFALSRFAPTAVLQGTAHGVGGRRLRKGLVVFQFAVSVALIAGTAVVYQQLDYLLSKDLGFQEEHVILIELSEHLTRHHMPPKQALLNLPGVESVSRANNVPSQRFTQTSYRTVGPGSDAEATLYSAWGDYDYTETLGIEIKKGRDFSRVHPSDSSAALINEAAARVLFGQKNPIGKRIAESGPDPYPRTVIGVVENFSYQSLRREIQPMVIKFLEFPNYWPNPEVMAVRIAPGNIPATLAAIERTWEQALPNAPFRYSFLDDQLDAQYRTTERFGTLFTVFAGLAIFIACLGLFGLAAYATERRTKEIGIRKTFGASVPSIVGLLSKDFLKLVGIAFVIAAPVAYFAMQRWLEDFAYRIDLGPWVFVGAGALALVIALATVSYQAIKAARANPVEALRYE